MVFKYLLKYSRVLKYYLITSVLECFTTLETTESFEFRYVLAPPLTILHSLLVAVSIPTPLVNGPKAVIMEAS
jgi:hypothetical protein